MTELGLGISDENRRTLEENVSVVFHLAASVRFDDPIRKAVFINVRGTREVVNLALKIKNLSVSYIKLIYNCLIINTIINANQLSFLLM